MKEEDTKRTYCIEYLEDFKSKLRLRKDEVMKFDKIIEQIKIGKKYKAICDAIEEEIESVHHAGGTAYSIKVSFIKIKRKYLTTTEEEHEKKMDKWFENLTTLQQADVAYNFWYGASYEDKKEEYKAE